MEIIWLLRTSRLSVRFAIWLSATTCLSRTIRGSKLFTIISKESVLKLCRFLEACFRYWLLRQKPSWFATEDCVIFLQRLLIFIYAEMTIYIFSGIWILSQKKWYFCIQIIYWRESVDWQLFSYCGGKLMDRQDWNVKETVSTMSRVNCFCNIYIKYYTI